MGANVPHKASAPKTKELTTTNGTQANGTGTGPYHRYKLDISTGSNVSIRWWSTGAGSATHMKVWTSSRLTEDRELLSLDPSTNFAWGPETPWKFIDTLSAESIPDGANTSGALDIWNIGSLSLLVEVLVSVDIPGFTQDFSVKA